MSPATDALARFAEGDLVRVRTEPALSVIIQPADRPATCDLGELPPLTVCCVPIALVRPAADPAGPRRWVELTDLSAAGEDE